MDADEVPQDGIGTYGGRRKLFYAVNADGDYVAVRSSGWEAEAVATGAALDALTVLRQDAWQRAQAKATSPLEYYMHWRRMDLALLAQTTGLSRWRIKRHFRPEIHAKLSERILSRYGDALGLPTATLRVLVENP